MIYVKPSQDDLIKQGDIFCKVPKIDFNLTSLPCLIEGQIHDKSWLDIINEKFIDENQITRIVASIKPVWGIVITQDCDAIRENYLTLCEIKEFTDVEGTAKSIDTAKSNEKKIDIFINIIKRQARINFKWFYLPPDSNLGFEKRMGVDFLTTLRIKREDLLNSRNLLRKGRLNDISKEHLRDRLANFYGRYPYDEWYSLNKEEFAFYKSKHPDAEPFDWQK
jgi:hypothetical protein